MTDKRKPFLLFFLITAFVFLPAPAGAEPAEVEGIVLSSSGPLADFSVAAYPDFTSLAGNSNAILAVPGDKPGQFRLQLEPGSYYLAARGSEGGKKLFAYHGLNPLTIDGTYRWLPFFAVESEEISYSNGPQGVGGRVAYRGEPLVGGVISVYPLSDSTFRGMGLLSNTLDESGRFWFDLEAGQYVLVARKRLGTGSMGPLRKGDLFCFPAANPVQVIASQAAELTINCYPRNDIDTFLASNRHDPRGRREEKRRTASLQDMQIEDASRKQQEVLLQDGVALQGTVRDVSGRPQPGLYVSAYPAEQFPLFQMFVIRLITDHITKTDANGRYRLLLEKGSSYYLVAREKIGEAPDHPERYGLYEGSANHSITVGPGKDLSQVDITVEQIMP
jgi:hypothetical protein